MAIAICKSHTMKTNENSFADSLSCHLFRVSRVYIKKNGDGHVAEVMPTNCTNKVQPLKSHMF